MIWIEERDMEQNERTRFFHVCTDGTVLPWMFKDNQDFIAGMNRIGICKVIAQVNVYDYTLMDNHVHFLLNGEIAECKKFIDKYKTLTGKWNAHKYGISRHLKDLPTSIIPLRTEDDILETAAYIDRNSVMAGFKGLPSEYPWGSSCLMFRNDIQNTRKYKYLKDFSENQLRNILNTRVLLPDDWRVDDSGMIDHTCYTEYRKMEKLFASPVRYLYFLTKKLEGKINITLAHGQKAFIPDKELRAIVENLAIRHFGTGDIKSLNVNARLTIARKLRYEYASSVKQIGRMVYLDPEMLKGFV